MGTPSIAGKYKGTYNIVVRSSDADDFDKVQACSGPLGDEPLEPVVWEWDFENSTVILEDGRLTPAQGAPMNAPWVDYTTREQGNASVSVLPFVDNLDGTYTVTYAWQIFPNGNPGPSADTTITLEISKLKDDSIAVVTVRDPDGNGIPGTPLPGFPKGATPDWRGRATLET